MKAFQVILVMLAFQLSAFAQKIALGTPIHVLDYTQLYSTFTWKPEVKSTLKAELGDMADAVVLKSNEAAWPKGIASLDARNKNKALFTGYTVFYLTSLVTNQAVLFVPAVENSDMPAGMAPVGDIYFVINGSAIEVKTTEAITAPVETEVDFATGMETLTQNFLTSFVNLFSLEQQEEEDGRVMLHGSSLSIESAEQIYFYEDVPSAAISFRAGFVADEDPTIALATYNELVRKVESLKLSCCQLTKDEETVVGNNHSQRFHVYNPNANISMEYQGMVIEVGIEQSETFTDDGDIVSIWVPVLYIYGE